jgi:replication factor C subunit 2/4
LELNASDERGIAIVREKIKSFASFSLPRLEMSPHRTSFKLIILDEADNITAEAQNALRRIMETYSRTTRLCFICNYLSRIIDPLISRCAKFRFKPLSNSLVIDRINSICEKEGFLNLTKQKDVVQTLIRLSKGDFRSLITNIQTISCIYGNFVTKQAITDVLGLVPTEIIDSIWSTCIAGSFDDVCRISCEIISHGYSTIQILIQIFDKVLNEHNIPETYRSKISCHLASSEKRLLLCFDPNLQLADILQTISRIMNNKEFKDDISFQIS